MFHIPEHINDTHTKTNGTNVHLHFLCNTSFICHFECPASLYTVKGIILVILNENICFKGLQKKKIAHTQKIKIFRVGVRVTPIKHFLFLVFIDWCYFWTTSVGLLRYCILDICFGVCTKNLILISWKYILSHITIQVVIIYPLPITFSSHYVSLTLCQLIGWAKTRRKRIQLPSVKMHCDSIIFMLDNCLCSCTE